MSPSPLAVLGVSAALSCLLLMVGASHWMVEKRARLQRVRTATGKRAGRVSTVGAPSRRRTSSCSRARWR